jgi:hypothetical protein
MEGSNNLQIRKLLPKLYKTDVLLLCKVTMNGNQNSNLFVLDLKTWIIFW